MLQKFENSKSKNLEYNLRNGGNALPFLDIIVQNSGSLLTLNNIK